MALETVVIKITGDSKDLDKTIDKLEKVGKVDRQNAASFKKTSSTLDGLKTKALALGTAMIGAFAIERIVGNAITHIKEFEKELSTLQSITGSTVKEMEFFKKAALDVGRSTKTAASEVVRAFTQIGSAQPELLKNSKALAEVTRQSLILAKAAGLDATQAAQSLTGAMNQFGAEAKDAAKFTDILATSQQKGSSFIADTTEALINSGAAASAAGLSFETTNAAIQALAKGNIKGARAGTALRGVLQKLAKQNDDSINPSVVGLGVAIENLAKRNLSLSDATKLVQEEGATGLLTLIKQVDLFNKLDGSLNETGNAMEQMRINTQNLDGTMEELSNTMEELSIKAGRGGGILDETAKFAVSLLQAFSGTGEEAFKMGNIFGITNSQMSELRDGMGTWGDVVILLQKRLTDLGFEVRDFGVTIVPNVEGALSVAEALAKWKKSTEALLDETEDLTKTEKKRGITVDGLKKQITEMRKAMGSLKIGSAELAASTKDLKTLELRLAIALGKTSKATKKAKDDLKEMIPLENAIVRILLGKESALEEIARLEEQSALRVVKGVEVKRTAADQSADEDKKEQDRRDKRNAQLDISIAAEEKFFNILSNLTNNRLIEVDNQFKTEFDALQAKLDNDLISREDFADQRKALEKKIDKERSEILRRQAINDRAAAIIEATIQGAIAVVRAFKTSRVLGVITAALVASEIATITAQPIPKFHEGKKAERSSTEMDAIIRRDETVVPPKPSKKFKKDLDAMIDGKYEKYVLQKYIIPAIESQSKQKFISEKDFYDKKHQKRLINLMLENNRLLKTQRHRQGFW